MMTLNSLEEETWKSIINNGHIISVIVPVYNAEQYLDSCVASILSQTYNSIEILLIDDGSTDKSGFLCDEYVRKNPRIKCIHQKNGGLSNARNTGLKAAAGQLILFVDSDDWIDPYLCEKCVRLIKQTSSDIVIFGLIKAYNNFEERLSSEKIADGCISKEQAMAYLSDDSFGNYAWNKLYKRELFEDIRYPEGKLLEDIGTTCYLFEKATSFCYLKENLYYYRQHKDSIMHRQTGKRVSDEFEQRYEQFIFFKRKNYKLACENSEHTLCVSALKYLLWFISNNEEVDEKLEQAKIIVKNNNLKFDFHKPHVYLLKLIYKYFPLLFCLFSKLYKDFFTH